MKVEIIGFSASTDQQRAIEKLPEPKNWGQPYICIALEQELSTLVSETNDNMSIERPKLFYFEKHGGKRARKHGQEFIWVQTG